MSEGETVQIVKIEDGKIVLNLKAFKTVLQKAKVVRNRVAVVSICGECGTGQSYVANYFLQDLRSRNTVSGKESVSNRLSETSWSCVPEDVGLPGIYLYKDILKTNDISVVLLQVQGSFTNDGGSDNCILIFALATLLSNVQIFTLKGGLQKNDFSFIKKLIKCVLLKSGEFALGDRLDMQLCFLIPEWSYPRDHEYGFQGGRKYFAHATRHSGFEGSTDAMHLNFSLRRHFKTTKCFLMPRSDLQSKFKTCFREFIESTLEYDGLSTSKFESRQINGELILEFTENCLKERSNAPEVYQKTNDPPGETQRTFLMEEKKTSDPYRKTERNFSIVKKKTNDLLGETQRSLSMSEKRLRDPPGERPKKLPGSQKVTEHKACKIVEVENQRLIPNDDLFDQILSRPEIGNKKVSPKPQNKTREVLRAFSTEEKKTSDTPRKTQRSFSMAETKTNDPPREAERSFSTEEKKTSDPSKTSDTPQKTKKSSSLAEEITKKPPGETQRSLSMAETRLGEQPGERPKKLPGSQKITEHKAYKIVEVENQRMILYDTLFHQILSQPEIGNKPIALVSIAGAFRMGKSFILNFFLRYMKNKGYSHKGDSWLGGEDAPLNEGFEWAGGTTRNTEGIVVYSQPFVMHTKEYGEVAVLFIDTQGLFDSQSTSHTNQMIFAFTAIISSVQILNISKHIDENHLTILQLFTEYTRTVKSAGGTSDLLQNLKFLVRDWQFEDDFAFGGDGGKKYLENYLKTNKVADELNSVREYITTAYSDVSCYLMPHPGQEFVKIQHGTGCIKDLDSMFLNNLTPLMDSVLNPENLVVKNFNGKPFDARGVYTKAITYAKVFKKGDPLNVPHLMKCVADAINNDNRRESLNTYTSIMEKRFSTNLSKDELKTIHDEVKTASIKKHYTLYAYGGSQKQSESKDHVKKEMDNNFAKFLAKLKHSKTEHRFNISNDRISAVEDCKKMMRKVPRPPEKFESFHEKCWRSVNKRIKKWMTRGKHESFENETVQDVEREKKSLYSIYKKHNDYMYEANIQSLENLDCLVPECTVEGTVESLYECQIGIKRVLEESTKHPDDIRSLYELAADDYEKSNYNITFAQYLNQLEQRMDPNEFRQNSDTNLKLKFKMTKLVADCLESFDNDGAEIGDISVDDRIFDSLVESCRADCIKKFKTAVEKKNDSVDQNLINRSKQKLLEGLNSRVAEMKKTNLRNHGHYKLAQEEMEMRVIRDYHTKMDTMLNRGYIPKKKLKEEHDQFLELCKADIDANRLPFFVEEGKSKNEDKAFCDFQKRVLKKIDSLFEKKKARNSRNHGIVVKALGNFFYSI